MIIHHDNKHLVITVPTNHILKPESKRDLSSPLMFIDDRRKNTRYLMWFLGLITVDGDKKESYFSLGFSPKDYIGSLTQYIDPVTCEGSVISRNWEDRCVIDNDTLNIHEDYATSIKLANVELDLVRMAINKGVSIDDLYSHLADAGRFPIRINLDEWRDKLNNKDKDSLSIIR